MATLHVTEFSRSGNSESGAMLQVAKVPPVADKTVTFTTSSVQSDAFSADTRFVRIHATANCHLRFAVNPTAVTTDMRMLADTTEYFAVNPGDKVAVIGV